MTHPAERSCLPRAVRIDRVADGTCRRTGSAASLAYDRGGALAAPARSVPPMNRSIAAINGRSVTLADPSRVSESGGLTPDHSEQHDSQARVSATYDYVRDSLV